MSELPDTESIDALAEKDLEELTTEANDARSRLLRTVEVLDRRRHVALDARAQVERHAAALAIGAASIIAGLTVATALVTHHVATARDRRRYARLRMLERLWRHPERAARGPGFFSQLGRSILVGLITVAVVVTAKKALTRANG